MVDHIKGSGRSNPVLAAQQQARAALPQKKEDKREIKSSTPQDEVTISRKALDLAAAEKAASQTRAALERDNSLTLGYKGEQA